jgi:hypothetical protein
VSALKSRATNPRTHSKKQIAQIANAIRRFGFTNPVLVDDANGIAAGHGRVEAAKIIGLDQVPTVRLSAMSEALQSARDLFSQSGTMTSMSSPLRRIRTSNRALFPKSIYLKEAQYPCPHALNGAILL